MRDAVDLERSGMPTLLLAHDRFFNTATALAAQLGMPDLNILTVSQPRPWHTAQERLAEVESIVENAARALVWEGDVSQLSLSPTATD